MLTIYRRPWARAPAFPPHGQPGTYSDEFSLRVKLTPYYVEGHMSSNQGLFTGPVPTSIWPDLLCEYNTRTLHIRLWFGQPDCLRVDLNHSIILGVTQPGHCSMECLSGTYAPNSAMGECILSTPGNHVHEWPVSRYPAHRDSTSPMPKDSCIPTDQGYISVEGASQQSACQPGTYQSQATMSFCNDSDPGQSPLKRIEQMPC